MEIKLFRGNDHQVKFKFKNFTGTIDKMYFTVKCSSGKRRLQKKLDDGIAKENEWYVITFVPKDTNDLECYLKMTYDIEIVVEGKTYTVVKDRFVLDEEVTRPEDEV